MKIDEYISTIKNHGYTQKAFDNYVIQCGGIDKLKKNDLDKMIHELPEVTVSNDSFMDIYKMVSDNESNRIIKIWTWIAGITSIVSLVISIISLFKK